MPSYDLQTVKQLAQHRWRDILTSLVHVPDHHLVNRNGPCPNCAGTDRFRFDDLDGQGTFFCNQCGGPQSKGGGGDGFMLVQRMTSWRLSETINRVGEWLNAPDSDFDNIPRHKTPVQKPEPKIDEWEQVVPVPQEIMDQVLSNPITRVFNPKKGKVSKIKATHIAVVKDPAQVCHGFVLRMETETGKIPVQVIFGTNKSTGETRLVMHRMEPPRTLYGADTIGESTRVVVVLGEQKRDKAAQILPGYPVVSIIGGDGSVVSMDWTPLFGRSVLIWPDNDQSGWRAAQRIAEILEPVSKCVIVRPPASAPEKWDLGDAFDEGWDFARVSAHIKEAKEEPGNAFCEEEPAQEEPTEQPATEPEQATELILPPPSAPQPKLKTTESDWPDPTDFLSVAPPPHFPTMLMPHCTGDYIQDQSEIIGCDPASIGIGVLVGLAAAIDDRIEIKPTRHKRWTEQARIWGAFVGAPSEKKTPGMSAALRPIRKIDAERSKQYFEQLASYKCELKLHQQSLRRKGEVYPEPVEPPDNRVMVGSTTIEAMQKILTHTERGVLVTHDELSGWFGAMDAYGAGKSGSKDRASWLQLYNGGTYRVDTIGRGSIHIKNWSACVLGAIQPDAIRKITKSLPEDGLMQRFIILCASGGSSVGCDRPEHPGLYKEYSELVQSLYNKGFTDDKVILTDEAIVVTDTFFNWARSMINAGFVTGGLAGYVGKFEGLFSRLLLVWHMAETANEDNINLSVQAETAQKVADFIKNYLFPHAVYYYRNIIGASDSDEDIRAVAQRVLVHDQDTISARHLARTIYRWSGMTEQERVRVMETLCLYGWVDPIPDPKQWNKVSKWKLNPKLKSQFAMRVKEEGERIERARQALMRG